jgi:UDP-glucose:(heptosyl)LPS alpha-1,3-glucosyltransferase
MKIAIVVKEHIAGKGGLERYAVTLSKGLASRGNEVHVYANRWDPDDSLIFHYVPYIRLFSLLKVLTFPINARKHLKKDSFDLVYSLTPLYPVDIYRVGEGIHADVLRARFPNPLRRFLRLLNPKHRAILNIEKKLFTLGNFRAIITNSKSIKERLIDVYNLPARRVNVIYNGYDDKLFNPDKRVFREAILKANGFNDDDKVICFAANDFKRKGLTFLLEALSLLKKREISPKLFVVGGDRKDPYKEIANKFGILDQVSFAGPVTDIEKYYGASDIFVLPTLYDPFSNACLEAFGTGLPVITTVHNGFSELIDEGESGYIIDSARNTTILADRIEGLFNLPDAGECALKRAKSLTIERNITKTLALCTSLNSSRKVIPLRANK